MKETELKPCPFCGGKVKVKDHTDNWYGFNGYEISCGCGCGLKSRIPTETIFDGNKISTPMTERSKAESLKGLIDLWNRSIGNEQREAD